MVWFQCEVCGEELKKPKLPNHFRQCSSYKLSCLDCGVTFDKQSVQSHTQCITEAEKYGPKGQGKAATGTPAKPTKDKPKPDVDINVGLSNRPPWFCSLCNTQATSKQALLLHADGKKHRAKARAFAAKNQPAEAAAPANKDSAEDIVKTEVPNGRAEIDKEAVPSNGAVGHDTALPENGDLSAKRKRKMDGSKKNSLKGLSDQNGSLAEVQEDKVKKLKHDPDMKGEENKEAIREWDSENRGGKVGAKKDCSKEKIKWKKLITSALKSASDGAVKMKKLRKLVYKSLQESGTEMDDSELKTILKDKVNSSSGFIVDGKFVRLAV